MDPWLGYVSVAPDTYPMAMHDFTHVMGESAACRWARCKKPGEALHS